MYKKRFYSYLKPNGSVGKGVVIIAKNGQEIAECKSDAMASKIIIGLQLYQREKEKNGKF